MPGIEDPMQSQVETSVASIFPEVIQSMNVSEDNSSNLCQILSEWRQQWEIDMRYNDTTMDDLIRDMANVQTTIRLKAIVTCARAAEYRSHKCDDSHGGDKDRFLPERLYIALDCCLDDEHEAVSRAAAIALYVLERPSDKAAAVLHDSVRDVLCVDRWIAARCLAEIGECDADIVAALVHQLELKPSAGDDPSERRRAAAVEHLARLSRNSTLVHSMVGELLNSSSWLHRARAVYVIGQLQGEINKDLVEKLSQLMWTDWNADVRRAAATTLGRIGSGKKVHDELIEKILHGNERTRVDALGKLGYLGIMTSRILPIFLRCFNDDYASVRMIACVAAAHLRLSHDDVVKKITKLAATDPVWNVKAFALQSVLKVLTPEIRRVILWAFRFETEEAVRAEACHSIVTLRLRGNDVIDVMHDRNLVEKSDVVKTEIIAALLMLGVSPTEDSAMTSKIKDEVRRLCTVDIISRQVVRNEALQAHDRNVAQIIHCKQMSQDSINTEVSAKRGCGSRSKSVKVEEELTQYPPSMTKARRSLSATKGFAVNTTDTIEGKIDGNKEPSDLPEVTKDSRLTTTERPLECATNMEHEDDVQTIVTSSIWSNSLSSNASRPAENKDNVCRASISAAALKSETIKNLKRQTDFNNDDWKWKDAIANNQMSNLLNSDRQKATEFRSNHSERAILTTVSNRESEINRNEDDDGRICYIELPVH